MHSKIIRVLIHNVSGRCTLIGYTSLREPATGSFIRCEQPDVLPQCACLSAPTSLVPSPHIKVTKPLLLSLVMTSSWGSQKPVSKKQNTCNYFLKDLLLIELLCYLLFRSYSGKYLYILNNGVEKL